MSRADEVYLAYYQIKCKNIYVKNIIITNIILYIYCIIKLIKGDKQILHYNFK